MCKLEPHAEPEKESPNKSKKKDPNKVDKKFLYPHGITPPCKNVRKRRFRKTLRKKNVEAPEIEKEVKRLFRIDNDAVRVEFEVIDEDTEKTSNDQQSKQNNEEEYFENKGEQDKMQIDDSSQKDLNVESDDENDNDNENDDTRPTDNETVLANVGEHDIFGEELSSSDDEADFRAQGESEESNLSDSSMENNETTNPDPQNESPNKNYSKNQNEADNTNITQSDSDISTDNEELNSQMNLEEVNVQLNDKKRHYQELSIQYQQKAQEINSIQNATLKQRMQETLDNLVSDMLELEREIKILQNQIM